MKKKLSILLAIVGVTAFSSSGFAIDNVIHDIADHTIGHGHHQEYYSYGHGGYGHDGYGEGYYGRPYYQRTRVVWSGGHRRHHSSGRTVFNLGHGRGHSRGH